VVTSEASRSLSFPRTQSLSHFRTVFFHPVPS
jgi:hypothetical protein